MRPRIHTWNSTSDLTRAASELSLHGATDLLHKTSNSTPGENYHLRTAPPASLVFLWVSAQTGVPFSSAPARSQGLVCCFRSTHNSTMAPRSVLETIQSVLQKNMVREFLAEFLSTYVMMVALDCQTLALGCVVLYLDPFYRCHVALPDSDLRGVSRGPRRTVYIYREKARQGLYAWRWEAQGCEHGGRVVEDTGQATP
ncbi:aquaporin-7 isoform X4 [Mus musculus]|uniref:aquaporin-7 isoform X4 n=1 Tax=Mus musculus TaxID=10090 RepID=UPI0003D78EA9|nr:aquaporin-7 isoform X4 [Mus musculus]|eukprot:XP_017175414.1 PREDICTED: aquaporin-7 isoform X4 [Mus musculus]